MCDAKSGAIVKKIKILIADDHAVVRDGVKQALSAHDEFEVIGEARDGNDAVDQAESLKPQIVIMDIAMPELNGIEATRRIKTSCPDTNIVVFTMHSNKEFVLELFRAGVAGYVLKADPTSDLVLAIKAVRQGGTYFSRNTPAILLRHMKDLEQGKGVKDGFDGLSQREREVFCLLADGKSVRDISDQLCISPKTVASHKHNIMGKLNAQTTTDLVKIAIKRNLIDV
jgi:DNA-binding NarL/FixJ family response regulator